MSTTVTCPRCGSVNPVGASFCAKCAGRLAVLTQHSPIESGKGVIQLDESRTSDFNFVRRSGVERTETALWLLVVGVLLASEPYTVGTGTTLIIIGFIMTALGRSAFGQKHSRLVFPTALIYFLGLAIGITNSILELYVPFPFSIGTLSQFEIGGLIALAVSGIAVVMLTYSLQKFTGKTLLWVGYLGSIGVNILAFYSNGSATVFPYVVLPFQRQIPLFSLLNEIPAGLTATAFYLVWRRINKGEIPKVQT